MRHTFYFYGISWRRFECVFGLINDLRWSADVTTAVLWLKAGRFFEKAKNCTGIPYDVAIPYFYEGMRNPRHLPKWRNYDWICHRQVRTVEMAPSSMLLFITQLLFSLTRGARWTTKCGTEIDYQITTYQVAMREILPTLVFNCTITSLALQAVKEEVTKDLQLKTTDQQIVVIPEAVVTLGNRNYSMFVAKEKGANIDAYARRELLGHMFGKEKTAELQKRYQRRTPDYGCAAATTEKKGRWWRVGVCLITY